MGRKGEEKIGREPERGLEAAVLQIARDQPQMGQAKVAEALTRSGYPISASGVRYFWKKHNLETAYKRLKALPESGSVAPPALTQAQRGILRRGDVSRKLARRAGRAAESGGEAVASLERRDQILFGAAQLFVERGYAGTSVRDIAERVGLMPGSVYHYFQAKEDLFLAVHQEGFRQLTARVSEVIRRGGNPWQKLELACAEHIHAVVAGNAISRIAATGLFSIHETHLQRRLKEDRAHYDRIFRELIAELDLPRGVDRSLFRLNLFGALNWTLVWYRPGRKTPPQLARQLVASLRTSRPAAA